MKRAERLTELFFLFARVSIFTVGGGLAMLPLVERELTEKRGWLGKSEFLDLFGVAQSMPGVMIMNVATAVGYKIAGPAGAVTAAVGTALPPFVSIVAAAWFLFAVKDSPAVTRVFHGLRPAIIAMVAVPVLTLGKAARMRLPQVVLAGLVASSVLLRVPPSLIILAAVAATLAGVFLERG